MITDGEGMPLVPIHVCWNDTEAEIVMSVLREYGIEAHSNSEVSHSVFPIVADGLGQVEVLVEQQQAGQARAILERAQQVPVYASWNAPEAERAISLLRQHGIKAESSSEVPYSIYYPLFSEGSGGIQVLGAPDEADKARQTLKEAGFETQSDLATGEGEQ